jgi:hypothetical protein
VPEGQQGEADTGCGIGEPDDADPAKPFRVIPMRAIAGSVI